MSRAPMPASGAPDDRDGLIVVVAAPLVWSLHFLVVYIAVSYGCVLGLAERRLLGLPLAQATIAGATLLAMAALAALGARGWRRWRASAAADAAAGERRAFLAMVASLLAGLSLIAAIWVALPAFLMTPCA